MKEKVFCVVTPAARVYYKATPVAKEFLDKDKNVVNMTGQIPDGTVAEFSVTSVTTKNFENGKLHGKLEIIDLTDQTVTFSEEYEHGQLVHVTEQTIPPVAPAVQEDKATPVYPGPVMKTSSDLRAFYVDGKQVAQETLSSNGATLELLGDIPDGEIKEFTENGKLKTEAVYKNNKLNGQLVRYTDDGKLLCKETYENGILKGPAEYYSYRKDDFLCTRCNYKNAVLDGELTLSQANGTLRERALYTKGRLHGPRTTFYSTGDKEAIETWSEGKLQGERTLFFPTGQVWCKENYRNGRLDGERTEFYIHQKPRLQEFYSEGLLDGKRAMYDEQGHLLTSEEYHWGNIVHDTESSSL
ncbi:MAG: toxin-antitoxin system YwqK family antitoxin [Elusimicrobiaceae bacterium]|nr:toxin-antitoxin system YwqK family antitoxin [Elusimicrobiaceae bacterium]